MKVLSHNVGGLAWLAVITAIVMMSACDPNRVFEANREIEGGP